MKAFGGILTLISAVTGAHLWRVLFPPTGTVRHPAQPDLDLLPSQAVRPGDYEPTPPQTDVLTRCWCCDHTGNITPSQVSVMPAADGGYLTLWPCPNCGIEAGGRVRDEIAHLLIATGSPVRLADADLSRLLGDTP
jgi:hypothetical protein